MRVSYFLAIGLLATGAVIARPDEILPLAERLAAPLLSTHRSSKAEVAPAQSPDVAAPAAAQALPSFVNTQHELTFTPEAAPVAAPAAPSETAAVAPAPIAPLVPEDASLEGAPVPADAAIQGVPGAAATTAEPQTLAPTEQSAAVAPEAPVPAGPEASPAIVPAKKLFGAVKGPSLLEARSIGSYARGCLAGAQALPVDGPAWQAMRLSRNRNWGHPRLVNFVEKLATTAQKEDGWPGLLVGDLSQPRGGPMLTGHASHQIGLDADVWLTPMPNRKLSFDEREKIAATSMLDKTDLAVDPAVFTDAQVRLIKRAASFPEVERVLVHPAIKKALCQAAGSDRGWLAKVRPIQGHYYHMHVRIGCPAGSAGCTPQKPVTGEDGCTKEVDEWLERMARAKLPAPPKPPGWKPSPPAPPVTIAQLPADCRMVLQSGPDGIEVPPEAMVAAAPVHTVGHAHAADHKTVHETNVVLRPVHDRRAPREARAR